MKLGLMLTLVAVVSYFVGTINFAKIISWNARRKDITKIGSKNPGTMNMLRSHGFGLALATFICEVAKSGLTCLMFKLIFAHTSLAAYQEIAYYCAALFMVLGYDFPVWSKFKGGKGVAVFAGVFLFSPLWYAAIGWFVLCFILLIIIDIGSLVSFTYTGGLTIGMTIYAWLAGFDPITSIVITSVLWFLYILMLAKHHANLKRLFTGTENKVGFKDKISKVFNKKKDAAVDTAPAKEEAAQETPVASQLASEENQALPQEDQNK
ncbi:MAG: glycerol-3-phosphate acyltransferase [Clostridia bacterium]|nr:glycerol-3-phosphate acyltransferase [Clostridia bacterium]